MQNQVKRFVDDRTRMLAAISHDLRTPITRLRLRVEAVVDEGEEQQKMLQDLQRMDAMIASALSFLRDASRDEPVELVDFASLLQSVCDDFVDTGREAQYVGLPTLSLRCRPSMLGRAVTNLIENAIKFGGTATVDLARDKNGFAVLHVDDDGPGIPDLEKKRAFDPFYRLDPARNSEIGGVGLGLSIARSIVQIHSGQIKLVDRKPRGLRVVVSLPARV
jgi:signal transduction histidine kinase